MTPTRIRLLTALAVLAGSTGWAVSLLVDRQTGQVVHVPWLAAATVWLLAAALLVWTLLARPRLRHRPGTRPMPPLLAARTAALAMAASRTGALAAGFYLGVAVGTVSARATEAGAQALWAALACAGGSLALAATALWLEHLCRLPADRDDDGPGLGKVSA